MGKKFSDLKSKQKDFITERMYEVYSEFATENGRIPSRKYREDILDIVCKDVFDKQIAISREELRRHWSSRQPRFAKRLEKELSAMLSTEMFGFGEEKNLPEEGGI